MRFKRFLYLFLLALRTSITSGGSKTARVQKELEQTKQTLNEMEELVPIIEETEKLREMVDTLAQVVVTQSVIQYWVHGGKLLHL